MTIKIKAALIASYSASPYLVSANAESPWASRRIESWSYAGDGELNLNEEVEKWGPNTNSINMYITSLSKRSQING